MLREKRLEVTKKISGQLGSGTLSSHEVWEERDALGWRLETEPITQIGEEGDVELAPGLHQASITWQPFIVTS